MHYSVLPIDYSMDSNIEYEEITYKNQLVLTRIENNIQTIERIYSTNPKDFLDPKFQPGTILENPLINTSKKCYNKYW